MTPQIIELLVGIALLTFGRKLFWIFVGTAGFLLGARFGAQFSIGEPEWVPSAVAFFAGLIGAIFAIFVQRMAVWIAGVVMGGYTVDWLLSTMGLEGTGWTWAALLGGGIAGAVSVLFVFDWALIVLSSVAGAIMFVQATSLSQPLNILLFLVLSSIGIAIQVRMQKRR